MRQVFELVGGEFGLMQSWGIVGVVGQWKLVLLGGLGEVARGAFVGDVERGRVVDALAVEEFGDGKDLQARMVSPGGFVEARGGGFSAHGFGGFLWLYRCREHNTDPAQHGERRFSVRVTTKGGNASLSVVPCIIKWTGACADGREKRHHLGGVHRRVKGNS